MLGIRVTESDVATKLRIVASLEDVELWILLVENG